MFVAFGALFYSLYIHNAPLKILFSKLWSRSSDFSVCLCAMNSMWKKTWLPFTKCVVFMYLECSNNTLTHPSNFCITVLKNLFTLDAGDLSQFSSSISSLTITQRNPKQALPPPLPSGKHLQDYAFCLLHWPRKISPVQVRVSGSAFLCVRNVKF